MNASTLSPAIESKNSPMGETFTLPLSVCTPTWEDSDGDASSVYFNDTRGGNSTLARSVVVASPPVRQARLVAEEAVLLEKWEGFVTQVEGDGFHAQMQGSNSQTVIAEFSIDELSEDDRRILAEGMPMVWCISRERRRGGVQRCSNIYLRRQSRPTPHEEAHALSSLNMWLMADEPTSSSR